MLYDYRTGETVEEKVPMSGSLYFIYQGDSFSASLGRKLLSGNAFSSKAAGFWMKTKWSKRYIPSFIQTHNIKMEDFEEKDYTSFDDFFVRKLKDGARPIDGGSIIAPCDGKHLFYNDLSKKNSFFVKGQELSLSRLLSDANLTSIYKDGSMIISRLAPPDYHRYHFPADITLNKVTHIPGSLFSVSPIALRQMVNVLTENKRMLVEMTSKKYGNILQVVIGATCVGTMHVTAEIGHKYAKGEELGYFSFGGSMVITLFQKNSIQFKDDLIEQTNNFTEVLLNMGDGIEKI
ncbi:archaetidylserine decarboxylase [bacterium]|nr:archaetidylserine decarboxylase [bacterium]